MSGVGYDDWSKLSSDLLRSILESLTTKDFHRARSVCSSWYSVSKTCTRPLYPWRVLLRKSSTLIFDPKQDETFEIEHPGIDFSESGVIASYSNWLLIIDSRIDLLYLLNVFTCERINLPSMGLSLLLAEATFQAISACLWMNERTGEYAVALSYMKHDLLFSYKKEDDTWRKHEGTRCRSMFYEKNKLYVLTCDDYVKILDLSGDHLVNHENVEGNPYRNHRFHFVSGEEHVWTKKIAVTNSGEVLIVLMSSKGLQGRKRLFYMFKMNFESGKWERVYSVGGEMLMLGHGVTVRSPIKEINSTDEGIKSDSICFIDDLWPSADYFNPRRQINSGIFDPKRQIILITWPKTSDASVLKSIWFVPGYA
ncbi:unnamed protein product [Eruca vesicaria subsp. sativa]|uniref:F-box domain-containing protein n=1 Tax=Eruca vesicaria subsp. sativa TaxID=29727 RepID=A0ABC8KHT7_ERUVS|nr:unnamed protein product [Eruca vesicaria subsp. sativa]